MGWVRTLSVGEAVAVLQSLHAIDLLGRIEWHQRVGAQLWPVILTTDAWGG